MCRSILTLLGLAALLSLGCAGSAPLPPAAIAHNEAGATAFQRGDLEAAGAHLELALEYNEDFVEALSNLGLVELSRGNFGRARQLLSRAVRLNPDFAQPHHGLGVLAERQYEPDVASDYYRAALRVDPGFTASRSNLARLLLEAGYVEHALVHYRKLIHSSPDDVTAHRGWVEALMALGRYEEVRRSLAEALAAFPDDPGLSLLTARFELHEGRLPLARQLCEKLEGRGDDFAVAALAWSAVIDLAESDPETALTHGQRALALDAEHPLATYAVAVALDDLADPQANAWLARAQTLNPRHPGLKRRAQPPPANH